MDDTASGFTVTEEDLSEEDFMDDISEPVEFDDSGEPIENQYWYCNTQNLGHVDNARTTLNVGGTNSQYVSYEYEFNQNNSVADSEVVGVGFNWADSSVGWSQTGTVKLSSNVKLTFPTNTSGHTAYRTNTIYREYRYTCTGASGSTSYNTIRPEGITGGWEASLKAAYPTRCSVIGPQVEMQITTGRTMTLTHGVNVTGPLGSSDTNGTVRLSITNHLQGGTSHALKFTNTANSTNKYVCGTVGFPGERNVGRMSGDWKDR